MNREIRWGTRFATTVALVLLLGGNLAHARDTNPVFPVQTDVDRAEHLVDSKGVPLLKIAGIGEKHNPAGVAIYALAYAGAEVYDPKLANLRNPEKFDACIAWLEQNLKKQPNGPWLWEYGFDSTYNDISIKAPWSSAFAQATGIQAFVAAYKRTGNDKYLKLANKAAQSLFMPLDKGGFLFQTGNDIWFEEIPQPIDNPSHILNGHMRVLLALKELADVSGDTTIAGWLKRGTDTLYRWLPRYDTGYWLRYDLNPRKNDLLFRFANPYGFANHPLAVDKITLRDPISKQEVVLDVGKQGDAEGANRIAGIHWGQIETLAGKTVRRLTPATLENKPDEMAAPHSYFYLALPGEWKDNLRDQWYEMTIDYYDDAAANITVQQRAVSPGATFRDMRDGDLHLAGAGQWRKWIVPVRPTDLGYWVGLSYADKHTRYLKKIAEDDVRFQAWARVANGYQRAVSIKADRGEQVIPSPLTLPKQTPVQPIFDLDPNGVVRQFSSATSKNGQYHLFMIADQLLTGGDAIPVNATTHFKREQLRREPALNWLTNRKNYKNIDGASVYQFFFDNVYNDVSTKAPWSSAFGQIYVLKALVDASRNGFSNTPSLTDSITKAANAFTVPIANGGISFNDRSGRVWYEEVPNATHVLNAHLVSVPELANTASFLREPAIQALADRGIQSLRDKLHLFDTGYWLRYDQNPKKELLLQFDWLSGQSAPLIDEILLQNPQTGRYVRLDVGMQGDAEGAVLISGTEWQAANAVDGKTVRTFNNGYSLHSRPVSGGTRHNTYIVLRLPDEGADDFDVPEHFLIIRYKDVAKGQFNIKVQAIHQGNQVTFVPLRGGIWETKGDQQWKESAFTIRPKDLGWYKGPDYQTYEVTQLQRIAQLTGDWFFSQYASRQSYFLEQQKAGRSAIIEPVLMSTKPAPKLAVMKETATYPRHGFVNALDGDPNNNYVAGIEGEKESAVEISLDSAAFPTELRIVWESPQNFAKSVKVYAISDKPENQILIGDSQSTNLPVTRIPLRVNTTIRNIRVSFSQFSGQPRLLLRQLEIK